MNFHSVQSKFYYSFFKLLMSPPNSFVVSSLLSLKRSVFGTGLSKLMLQVWHHMALCGQSGDHAVASCDPQQQPGFKRDLKNNKSQSKPNTSIGGRWWWSPMAWHSLGGAITMENSFAIWGSSHKRWRPCTSTPGTTSWKVFWGE